MSDPEELRLSTEDRLFLPADTYRSTDDVWDVQASWLYETGFREAGDLLIDRIIERGHALDPLLYPAIYAYRHYLELVLKAGLAVTSPRRTFRGHDLPKLWGQLREAVVRDCPGAAAAVPIVDGLIEEMAKVDPRSDGFRYATRRPGERSLTPDVRGMDIYLPNLRAVMSRLGYTLEHWNGELKVAAKPRSTGLLVRMT